jgi:hypothetical protein
MTLLQGPPPIGAKKDKKFPDASPTPHATRVAYRKKERAGAAHPKNAGKSTQFPTGTMTQGKVSTMVQRWQHDWRRQVGERPTESNAEVFHSYVEMAYQLLEEFSSADFIYSEVRQVCQPQYLFQVVCDMSEHKLSMRIWTTEEGYKAVSIHKI